MFACSIDYEKVFDCVKPTRKLLMDILTKIGLDKDIRIIAPLCWEQTASIRTENKVSEEINQ